MQRLGPMLGLFLAAGLCACSSAKKPLPSAATPAAPATISTVPRAGSTATGAATSGPGGTPAPDPLLGARLQSALLTLNDLPGGWSTANLAASGTATDLAFCGLPSVESQELGRAEADFQRSALGPYFTEELAQTQPGVAASQLDALSAALPGCQPQSQTQPDGSTLTYTVTPLAFPTLGEQSVAVQLKVDGSLLPIQANAVFIRRADTVAIVALLVVGLVAPDPALTEELARRADARLALVAR